MLSHGMTVCMFPDANVVYTCNNSEMLAPYCIAVATSSYVLASVARRGCQASVVASLFDSSDPASISFLIGAVDNAKY
jgi:hypothetical protein